MITDPTLLHEIKEFVGSGYYPIIFTTIKERFASKLFNSDPVAGKEDREHWYRMSLCLKEFDKELRNIVDTAKFRS